MALGNEQGFTLVELMIVVIIVGVLAAVSLPLLSGAADDAKASEAAAALGAIRGAMRVYYAEHGTYADTAFVRGASVTSGGALTMLDSDLNGRYFSSECYTFTYVRPNGFRIRCSGVASTAPAGEEVRGLTIVLNQDGDIWSN